MRFAVLASGSKANCSFLEAGSTRILIDCGLSARETARRLALHGIPAESLSGILVTHEHRDHILGIAQMSKRFKVPIFANRKTARFLKTGFGIEEFETGVSFELGSMSIAPFSITHDAHDPVGFTIRAEGLQYSQATDLGKVTPLVREAVRGANVLVLESNHDKEMLQCCGYPWELKQRIASAHGHLSNDASAELLLELFHDGLRHVVLGHLSENSNTPDLALSANLTALSARVELPVAQAMIRCANPYNSTPLLAVDDPTPSFAVSSNGAL